MAQSATRFGGRAHPLVQRQREALQQLRDNSYLSVTVFLALSHLFDSRARTRRFPQLWAHQPERRLDERPIAIFGKARRLLAEGPMDRGDEAFEL